MEAFLIKALIGGIGVATICGPLGCLVVWQRMAYFGAALSHAALLGISLGLFFKLNLQLSILAVCIIISYLLLIMGRFKYLATDTALGILAHGSLAIGILVFSVIPSLRMDLMSYLFGDILSINWVDIAWIYLGGLIILGVLVNIWRPLLSLTIQRDLALVDGINEQKTRILFFLLISLVVAIAMQIVGVLLIVSLLIIPAATARRFAGSPEQMALIATIAGVISVCLGLAMSLIWDTPTGPSIVAAASILFLFSASFRGGGSQFKTTYKPG